MDLEKFNQMVNSLANEYINDEVYGSKLEGIYLYNLSNSCARLILIYSVWNSVLNNFAKRGAHFWEFYADSGIDLRVYPMKLEDFNKSYESITSKNNIQVLYDKAEIFNKLARQLTK